MASGILDTKTAEGYLIILKSIIGLFARLGGTRRAILIMLGVLIQDLRIDVDTSSWLEDAASPYDLCHFFHEIIHTIQKLIDAEDHQTLSASLLGMATTFMFAVASIGTVDRAAADRFSLKSLLRGRSLGITKSGRAFNAMNRIQEGDCVFALEGSGDRLWTLRPVADGRYRLVGDIWVHGIMSGQLYDGIDPKDVDYDIEIA